MVLSFHYYIKKFQHKMEEKYYLDLDRIPVFIGSNGNQKKIFEKKFNCNIIVNSKNGEVDITCDDSVNLFILSNIISAINHGHSPKNAMKLEDENFVFDIIDVKRMIKDQARLKVVLGRIIGKEGSTRKAIEEVTQCSVSVKDHFVSVIGPFENTILVHEALDMLIKGASHKSFYSYLERNKVGSAQGIF